MLIGVFEESKQRLGCRQPCSHEIGEHIADLIADEFVQNLIVALFRFKVSKDNSCLAVHLIVDDRITLACRIADFTLGEWGGKHLYVIVVLLLLRCDTDSYLSSTFDSLDILSQKKVGFHIDDAFQSFCKELHLSSGMQRQPVGLKYLLQDVSLQVIEDKRRVLAVSYDLGYAVGKLLFLVVRHIGSDADAVSICRKGYLRLLQFNLCRLKRLRIWLSDKQSVRAAKLIEDDAGFRYVDHPNPHLSGYPSVGIIH